jgi:hypothetical protein
MLRPSESGARENKIDFLRDARMINLLAVDGPERLVIVVVWLVESSNPQQFVARGELEVHERRKIFGEYLFIR